MNQEQKDLQRIENYKANSISLLTRLFTSKILYFICFLIGSTINAFAADNKLEEEVKDTGRTIYRIVLTAGIVVAAVWGIVVAIQIKTKGKEALKQLIWWVIGMVIIGSTITIVKQFAPDKSNVDNDYNSLF